MAAVSVARLPSSSGSVTRSGTASSSTSIIERPNSFREGLHYASARRRRQQSGHQPSQTTDSSRASAKMTPAAAPASIRTDASHLVPGMSPSLLEKKTTVFLFHDDKALFAKWKMSDRILIESDNAKSNLTARPVTNLPLNTNASIRRSFQQLPKEGADKSTKVEEIVTSGVEDTTVRHPASLNNAPHTTGIRAKADPEVEERENKSHQEGEAGARTGAAAAGLHDDSRLRHPRPLTPGTRRALQRTVSLQHLPSLRHTGQQSDKHSSLQVDTTHARLRPVHNTMQPDCF